MELCLEFHHPIHSNGGISDRPGLIESRFGARALQASFSVAEYPRSNEVIHVNASGAGE
jgi:hypothetical protein